MIGEAHLRSSRRAVSHARPGIRSLAIIFLVVACGVSTQAARRQVSSSLAPDAAFTKAMRVLAEFNYTVVDSDRESGFIRAERRATGSTEEILGGSVDYWVLTVSILSDSVGSQYVLQPDIRREGGAVWHRITGGHQAVLDSITTKLDQNEVPRRTAFGI